MTPDWEEVERAMAAALALPESEVAEFLERQPIAIRAEVESLLDAYRRSKGFLGDDSGDPVAAAAPLGGMHALLAAAVSDGPPAGVDKGTQIGPYRIEGAIGKGGMGVVYRAHDSRLNRTVAIKFLWDELADPAARRRFQREAQMASALDHPHIVTVHDVGDFAGQQYLVTEFVDGGTLKDWAGADRRTWREIVPLLLGVADGLAAAHAAGITHRDIKPENVLVGQNGYAKLSDFGLAKLEARRTQGDDAPASHPGMILGTIAYMSPEQASGRPVDSRSDIFSFGVLLYELLAGRRPFEGANDLEVLKTVVHGAAPPLAGDIPLALRTIVEKALEKDPAERYQSTRDLVVDLRRVTRRGADLAEGTPQKSQKRNRWVPTLIAVAGLVAIALAWIGRPKEEKPRQVLQFDIQPPPGVIFTPPVGRQPFAISPDGKRLAFIATGPAGTNVQIRDLASADTRIVPGSAGAWSVFWQPDSRSVFFSVKQTLMQFNLETGSGRSVAELTDHAQIGTWRPNGDLLLYLALGETFELRAQDGNLRKLPADDGVRWPQFLPGGERFVYVTFDAALHGHRAMASNYLNRKPVPLMATDTRVEYAPPRRRGEPGYLLFIRGPSLLAQPFDAESLRMTGEPFPIAQDVIYYGPTVSASFSVSTNGQLVYQAGFPLSELKWYDRAGKEIGVAGKPLPYWGNVRISPDGRRVATAVWNKETGAAGTWIFDANGSESRQLAFAPEIQRRPVWSRNGLLLAVGRSSTLGGRPWPRIATLDVAGGGPPQTFETTRHMAALPTDWSPDDRFIAVDDGVGDEAHDIWIADVAARRIAPFLENKFQQRGLAFSPDGRQIAFESNESGRPEVYLQGFVGGPSPRAVGDRRQVSRDGAWLVRWRADGREMFYLGLDNVLHAVAVNGLLEFGNPRPLFRFAGAPQYGTTRDFQFDVSPDGQKFLMPTTGSTPPPPFTVIENWQDRFHR
jgi:serine/threonine protein kinase